MLTLTKITKMSVLRDALPSHLPGIMQATPDIHIS